MSAPASASKKAENELNVKLSELLQVGGGASGVHRQVFRQVSVGVRRSDIAVEGLLFVADRPALIKETRSQLAAASK